MVMCWCFFVPFAFSLREVILFSTLPTGFPNATIFLILKVFSLCLRNGQIFHSNVIIPVVLFSCKASNFTYYTRVSPSSLFRTPFTFFNEFSSTLGHVGLDVILPSRNVVYGVRVQSTRRFRLNGFDDILR